MMTYTQFINEVKMTCCSMYFPNTDNELYNMYLSAQRVIKHRIRKDLEQCPSYAEKIYPQEHLNKYAKIYAEAAISMKESFQEANKLQENYNA